MGAWGTGLYQDDTAIDIRDTIKNELKLGKSLSTIISQLKSSYEIGEYENNDEEPVFWCALADTLWKLGRLDNETKNIALNWIEKGGDIKRWEYEDSKLAYKRKQVFLKLKDKLISPQPSEKKISKQRFYICPWNLGDVFAMKLNGKISEEKGLLGTYLLFQVADKHLYSVVSDKKLGHLCPIVRAKLTLSTKIPQLADFVDEQIIKTDSPCKAVNWKNIYATLIYTTSTRVIPKDLIFLGNKELVVPEDDYGIFHDQINVVNNMNFTSWKNIEEQMITNYFFYNLNNHSDL